MNVMDAMLVVLWLGLMLTWVWGEVAGRLPRIRGPHILFVCCVYAVPSVHWAARETVSPLIYRPVTHMVCSCIDADG